MTDTEQQALVKELADVAEAHYQPMIDVLARALHWIANSPAAHPANMVRVAKDALDAVSTTKVPNNG
jgi:hypothetical protein